MRFLNIFIGLVILICIIFVSYSHTVLLFNSVGIVGWKGHLATIAVEATFILSCFNLVVTRLKKYKPGFFAIAGFFYGSGLTAWSNISFSFEYGITGWILGAAIPVGLWIAEGIISHSLLRKPTNQVTDQPTVSNQTIQPNGKVVDQMAEEVANDQPPTNQVAEIVVENQPSTNQSTSQPTTTNQSPTNQSTTTKMTSYKTNMVGQKPINKTAKSTNRKKSTNKAAEEERIKKAYFDYVEQNGKPPSQREWAEEAGVSRYKIIKFIEKHGEPKKSA